MRIASTGNWNRLLYNGPEQTPILQQQENSMSQHAFLLIMGSVVLLSLKDEMISQHRLNNLDLTPGVCQED